MAAIAQLSVSWDMLQLLGVLYQDDTANIVHGDPCTIA
jgi:hypothetical protein